MVHVGAGWALARLGRRLQRPPPWLDPLLGWLALDGYGFHEGYFRAPLYILQRLPPGRLTGYARRAFDQGLGRSLWFVYGADVFRIVAAISAFPVDRQADLWSGVGLAASYAGGVGAEALHVLQAAAGSQRHHLAQGAVFAAKARALAGIPTPHTVLACDVLCRTSLLGAARVAEAAMEDLPPDGQDTAYEVWRGRIRARMCLHLHREVALA
jgi:hypothetical protein